MTKRFTIVHLRDINICDVQDTLQDIPTFYNDLGRIESVKPVVDLLNEQHEENIELKHDNKRLVKFIMSKGYTLKDYLEWLQKEVWE